MQGSKLGVKGYAIGKQKHYRSNVHTLLIQGGKQPVWIHTGPSIPKWGTIFQDYEEAVRKAEELKIKEILIFQIQAPGHVGGSAKIVECLSPREIG